MKSADDQNKSFDSKGFFEYAMEYIYPLNNLEEKLRQASMKQERSQQQMEKSLRDNLASNSNAEEMFGEVGPRK